MDLNGIIEVDQYDRSLLHTAYASCESAAPMATYVPGHAQNRYSGSLEHELYALQPHGQIRV